MPATIITNPLYNFALPFKTSASIDSMGLVTGSASFLLLNDQSAPYSASARFPQSLIPSLKGVRLSGLFVESVSIEKLNGLEVAIINLIGATNPPVVERRKNVSARSIAKAQQIQDDNNQNRTVTFSFDYLAETTSAAIVVANGQEFDFKPHAPRVSAIWNRQGQGTILNRGEIGEGSLLSLPRQISSAGTIYVYGRIIEVETREERAGLVFITKTSQFVYE